MKNLLLNFRFWVIGTPAIIILIFIIQNAGRVNVGLLFWYFETSKSVLIILSMVIGLLMGIILTLFLKSGRNKEAQTDKQEDTRPPSSIAS